jgi:drug/metabolite transporter (DMT)-like permease
MRSSPAIVLLLAVLILKEDVTMLGVIGIFTILAGVYCINLKKVSLQGFLEPLSSLRERSTQFALLTAITVAMYSIVDKLGVAQMHPVIFVYLITVFVMIFNTIYVFALKKRHLVWDEWKSHPGMIVCNGFLTMFSYLLILIALTFERASYVTSLRQLSIVFGVMFGGHLLREKHKVLRLSASSLILAGVLCISLSS